MRIPSGTIDQFIYFVAVDATDLTTRETGLSSFTVYRSRNGGAAAAMTTPTINEVDATNMPGVYELLLDEDMTIDAGDDSQEMAFHITHAGMAPLTRTIEIYRPKITVGETLTVASGIGEAAVQSIAAAAITASSIASSAITDSKIASGALTAAKFAAGAFDAVWSVTTRLLTAGTNIVLAKGTGVTGFNDPTADAIADQVWDESTTGHTTAGTFGEQVKTDIDAILVDTAEIGSAGAGLTEAGGTGDQFTAIPWNAAWDAEVESEVNDALIAQNLDHLVKVGVDTDFATTVHLDSVIGQIADKGTTPTFDRSADSLEAIADSGGGGPTAGEIADAVWDEPTAGHTTADTFGEQLKTDVDAILVGTDEIGAAGAGLTEAGGTGDHLTAVPWNAAWDAEVQSEVQDAIEANHLDHLLAVTYDPAAKPGAADALLNEMVESDLGVSRFTANALEQAPSGGASAADIADAVWDEARSGHTIQGTYGESNGAVISGTVDTSVFTPTTTQFEADDITEATADHFIGRIIIFLTGALAGQATDITDYALSGSNGRFTVTALTEAPANDDTFIIV